MAKKKKGEVKLIMPKHTASVDHLKYALKVCIAHPGGVDVDTFKDELFAELHTAGIEAAKNNDSSHYTKCLQLPRYFGLVRYCLSGERANAITKRGIDVYTALIASPVDKETLHGCFLESIIHNQFGQGNEGVGSESFCEPLAIFFRAVEKLDGIENHEYGYLIQEMDAKGRPFEHVVQEIRASRASGAMLQMQAQAQNISDWKTILFLVNIGFLEKRPDGRVVLSRSLPVAYRVRLMRMPLYGRGFKKQLFMRWMESKNLGQSVLNYADSLEAITEDGPLKDSARFCGFYECLTGGRAAKKIYDVAGLEDYNKTFGALELFWSKAKDDPPYPFEEDRYYECYYYAKGAKRIDNARLENACQQYKQFLSFYDTHKEAFSAEEETMYTGKLGSVQKIIYGAPGTGKSFGTDDELVDANGNEKAVSFRTTFHPDSDYSTFVGAYKPTMKKVPRIVQVGMDLKNPNYAVDVDAALKVEEKISYEFRPQAFMNAYVAAWKEMTKGAAGKPVVLVIEEINRGNCAQIFGDLFQLLDRGDDGYSTYPIDADTDLAKWLKSDEKDENNQLLRFGSAGLGLTKPTDQTFKMKQSDWDAVMKGKKLALPPNLYIWATMNTSDQSLFPIDSAFKRRWDWKYVPIREGKHKDGPKKGQELGWKIKFTVPAHQEGSQQIPAKDYSYDWWEFLKNINAKIFKTTESEDKKLGYFFVKPDGEDATTNDGTISADRFVSKVIFYLWNDVFKDYGIETIFKVDDAKKSEDEAKGVEFQAFFNEEDDKADVNTLLRFFKHIELKSDEEIAAAQAAQQQPTASAANQQGQNTNP